MGKQLFDRDLIFFVGGKFRNDFGDPLIFGQLAFLNQQPRSS